MSTENPRRRRRPDLGSIEALACECLTSPRALTPRVIESLVANHEVLAGEAASWLRKELAGLESYEQDLLLSPLFTPDLETRLRFEEVLGEDCLDAGKVEEAIGHLADRSLLLTLLHQGERIEAPLPVVVIERFVRLLHLDAPLPEEALAATTQLLPEVRCYLRDRTWQRRQSRELLPALLEAAQRIGKDFPAYIHFLTDFVRSYRPASRAECLTFLQNLTQAYKDDLEKHQSGARPFFSEELRVSYAGRWSVDEDVVTTHKRMISMAESLQRVLH